MDKDLMYRPSELHEKIEEINALVLTGNFIKALLPIVHVRRHLNQLEDRIRQKLGMGACICLHCLKPYGHDYMVHDSVWREAVPDVAERYAALEESGLPRVGLYLHLECLEKRLGRPVTVHDLKPVPCNDAIRYFLKPEKTA